MKESQSGQSTLIWVLTSRWKWSCSILRWPCQRNQLTPQPYINAPSSFLHDACSVSQPPRFYSELVYSTSLHIALDFPRKLIGFALYFTENEKKTICVFKNTWGSSRCKRKNKIKRDISVLSLPSFDPRVFMNQVLGFSLIVFSY